MKDVNLQEAFMEFDKIYGGQHVLPNSLVPVNGQNKSNIQIASADGKPNEEYYKWKFVYALLNANLGYDRDCIGVEVEFPKGSGSSAALRIDCCVFDDRNWLARYQEFRAKKQQDDLEFLRTHLVGVVEFKRSVEKTEDLVKVVNMQLRPALKESDAKFVLGAYYDIGRLYLFKRVRTEKYKRFDDQKNLTYSQRLLEQLSLELPDPYYMFPPYTHLTSLQSDQTAVDYSQVKAADLDVVSRISDVALKASLNNVLRKLDSLSLVNEEGYQILIQTLAFRIFDEKRSLRHNQHVQSYVTLDEFEHAMDLNAQATKTMVDRFERIVTDAIPQNPGLFDPLRIIWSREKHVQLVTEILWQFQKYSLARSESSDLYQMVFYNFATKFKKDEKAQFLTPLPVIEFLVDVVNPKDTDSLCDPCMGIGDFLSISYVRSDRKMDESRIYGVDLDDQMTLLAQLNMILNGDGRACLLTASPPGSISRKIDTHNKLVELDPRQHKNGNWDSWTDGTSLMKFDIVLTNPPFGRGRSFRVRNETDRKMMETYELWNAYRVKSKSSDEDIDLGVVFLENAYRILKEDGRLGMVLSKSIASTSEWSFVVKWLLDRMRVVALFELPSDVFAETGVPVVLLVAYKPKQSDLDGLKQQNYSVFAKEIERVGYHKKTVRRNVVFETDYRMDTATFEVVIDERGKPVVDEDFTSTVREFRRWCRNQEGRLRQLFL